MSAAIDRLLAEHRTVQCRMPYAELCDLIGRRGAPGPEKRTPNFWTLEHFPKIWRTSVLEHEREDFGWAKCQMCGWHDVKYLHTLSATFRFPDGTFREVLLPHVGSKCADALLGTKEASKAEARQRARRARPTRLAKSPRWRTSASGNEFLRVRGQVALVKPLPDGWFGAAACINDRWRTDTREYRDPFDARRAAVALLLSPENANARGN